MAKYDLEERTAVFGELVLDFCRQLPRDQTNRILTSQLIRSATSIGANYMEADGAESKKDFKHKLAISKKEAKETKHWLRMLARVNPDFSPKCKELWQEANELVLIFSTIINKLDN